jgi:hypothetical protein
MQYLDCIRTTTLQENMIMAAKEAELQERPVIRFSKVLYESRASNLAIKTSHEVKLDVLLNRLPTIKIDEFIRFPLSAQLGFIHAIPEQNYDIATATITDVGFMGLFPKTIFQVMRKYGREIERFNDAGSADFYKLVDDHIAAFVYRPITIQKIVHILLAQWKSSLEMWDDKSTERLDNNNTDQVTMNDSSLELQEESNLNTFDTSSHQLLLPRNLRKCHAVKCGLLQTKGIITCPMICAKGKSYCSGCGSEFAKQRKVKKLENEILNLSVENNTLAPLLEFRTKPTSIKHFRNILSCLPSISQNSRDDNIFGAVRYLANTLGILNQ